MLFLVVLCKHKGHRCYLVVSAGILVLVLVLVNVTWCRSEVDYGGGRFVVNKSWCGR